MNTRDFPQENPIIRLDVEGGIATVTFTQPARGNPIDGPCCRAFRDSALALWNTEHLRAVHLRAEGANFSFGGDVKSFYSLRERLGGLVREWTADLHTGLQRFWQLPVPVVAEVQGFAMGGAVALVAGCDFVLAGSSARFGSAFAQLGFSCDTGSTVTLAARLGVARAKRFMLKPEIHSSAQAHAMGLVDEVVEDNALAAEARSRVEELAAGPTLALGEIKRLFLRTGERTLTLARIAASADAREGIAAMVERRKPQFKAI